VADLERLLQLDARNLGITDLSGLEMARNLYHVDLSDNNISNLSPLANLDNIQVLRLTNNDVASVVSLADLVNLDQLYLAGNPVGDIQPLRTNAINGGLGDGDYVELDAALLSDTALAVDVPFLESQGVTVQLVGGGDNGDGDDGNGGA
jgi:Leucine-rich repeat (LRR) protein